MGVFKYYEDVEFIFMSGKLKSNRKNVDCLDLGCEM